jgi:hypothetical protein
LKAWLPLLQEPAPSPGRSESPDEEDPLVPGTEHPLVLHVPSDREVPLRGRLLTIEPGRPGVSLSATEWAALLSEEEDA